MLAGLDDGLPVFDAMPTGTPRMISYFIILPSSFRFPLSFLVVFPPSSHPFYFDFCSLPFLSLSFIFLFLLHLRSQFVPILPTFYLSCTVYITGFHFLLYFHYRCLLYSNFISFFFIRALSLYLKFISFPSSSFSFLLISFCSFNRITLPSSLSLLLSFFLHLFVLHLLLHFFLSLITYLSCHFISFHLRGRNGS